MGTEETSEKTPVAVNNGAAVDSPKVDSVTDDAIKNSHRPGRISKYIEQMTRTEDAADPDEQKAEAKPAATKESKPTETKEKPCPGCGDKGKSQEKPETRQAIATLPMPDGSRKAFYSAEELEDYVEKVSTQRKSGLTPEELKDLMGGQSQPADAKKTEEDDSDLDLLDPVLKKEVLRSRELERRLNAIEGNARVREQNAQLDAVKSQIAEAIPEIRKAHVFDDIVDDTPGGLGSVTEKIYGGVVAWLSNDDVMNKRKQKPIRQYFEDAAKTVAFFQSKLKSPSSEMTTAILRTKHPKVAEEIAQQAVVDYLATKKEVPPTISGSASDNLVSGPDNGRDKAKSFGSSIHDAVGAWMKDTSG